MVGRTDVMSRREFMRLGLGTAAYTAASQFLPCVDALAQKEHGYKAWERGYSVDGSKLPRFVLRTVDKPPINPRILEKISADAYKAAFAQNKKDPNNPKKIWVPRNGRPVEWSSQNVVVFEFDRSYAQRIIDKSKDSLEDSRTFFDSPYLARSGVRFVVPTRHEEIPVGGDDESEWNMVVCYDFKEANKFIINYPYGSGYARVEVPITEDIAGLSSRDMVITPRETHVEIEHSTKPIFFSLNHPPIVLVETPPLEILHHQLRQYTIDHTKNGLAPIASKKGELTREEIYDAINRWIANEEIFVHALGNLWLLQFNYSRNMGFDYSQIEERLYNPLDKLYQKEMGRMFRRISGLGVKESIELYAMEPSRLFE